MNLKMMANQNAGRNFIIPHSAVAVLFLWLCCHRVSKYRYPSSQAGSPCSNWQAQVDAQGRVDNLVSPLYLTVSLPVSLKFFCPVCAVILFYIFFYCYFCVHVCYSLGCNGGSVGLFRKWKGNDKCSSQTGWPFFFFLNQGEKKSSCVGSAYAMFLIIILSSWQFYFIRLAYAMFLGHEVNLKIKCDLIS